MNRHTLSLDQIRNYECRECSLWESAVNVCVMGRGNERARVVLIGEAPGEAEQRTGKPFMGKSGQLLQGILDDLSLADCVYITNIAKCRPPENRKPTHIESATCSSLYLSREIAVIQPSLIVCLGRTPSDLFMPLRTYTRGMIYNATKWGMTHTILPTWHPSYCLRAGHTAKDELRQHLVRAKQYIQRKELP